MGNLHESIYPLLACPGKCKSALQRCGDKLTCENPQCRKEYPIVNGVPVLINDGNSLFSVEDFTRGRSTATLPLRSRLWRKASKFIPSISLNTVAARNYRKVRDLLLQSTSNPLVLIVGSGDLGAGLQELIEDPRFIFVESDVYFGNRVQIVADGHDLPFRSGAFDGVICQAVLEHVVDPPRCVQEMYRVLKPDGLTYAEIPFVQQVHMQGYDFTRYTLGGFRRLFRNFREVEAGVSGGPGMALTWTISYFFGSFSRARFWTLLKVAILPFFIFWLKYFDYFLVNKPSSSDAASGVYFLGYKSSAVLSDREILHKHWTYRK